MSKLLIIDGSAILHRAYHALPPFKAADGTPTNAVYGFIKMLFSLCDKLNPDYLAVCFDTPKPSFRKQLLTTYQAQRPAADEEYKTQIPLTQEFVAAAKIAAYFKEGYEADDVIGTLATQAVSDKPQLKVFIVTGDKDLLQLVNNNTTLVMPKKGVNEVNFLDQPGVMEKLGIKPEELVFYKALVGDPSDNYKGIKGIGPKKAVELIKQYHNLDNLYRHLTDLDERTRELLASNKQEAYLSEKLAQIELKVPLEFNLKQTSFNFSQVKNDEVSRFLNRLGLKSILKQINSHSGKEKKADIIKSESQLDLFN